MPTTEARAPLSILAPSRARDLVTAVVLMVGLLVSWRVWEAANHLAHHALQTEFDFRARDIATNLSERLKVYGQMLRAGAGLFQTAPDVSRQKFRQFYHALALAETYPGMQGFGFSKVIPAAELEQHVAAVRAQGFSNYAVWPQGSRPLYSSVIYLEPFGDRNLRAFGYDMYAEPIHRTAMATARDTGTLTASGKVVLVQEMEADSQAGFLIYMPVYNPVAPNKTPEQRREHLFGWVYASFRAQDFIRGAINTRDTALDLEIYDGATLSKPHLLYDGKPEHAAVGNEEEGLRRVVQIDLANHTWSVVVASTPEYVQQRMSERPRLLLHAGITLTLMGALLTWLILFLDDRSRALQAADQALQRALYDSLTGLPSRKLLEERMQQALANARRHHTQAALLFIDLDRFKPVNDRYGHAYGDQLLKDVAYRLRGCMRETDTAARLGGDEFVALLAEVESQRGVEVAAMKILAELNQPYNILGKQVEISASLGAAIYPEHGTDAKALLRSADLAMYDAKRDGGHKLSFAPPPGQGAMRENA